MTFTETNHPALYYQDMLSDRLRNSRYREAIQAVVQPGDVVVDLGTGLGLLAMMAAQAGAAHVYAVDVRPHVIPIAERVIAANSLENKITLIQGDATEITLPGPVDVIVNELIGDFGTDENIHECVSAVAAKHLKPGGRILPGKLSTHIAGVNYDGEFRGVFAESFHGLNLASALTDEFTSGTVMYGLRKRATELTEIGTLELIEFSATMVARKYDYPLQLMVERAGVLQGFVGFFKSELTPAIELTNYPCYPGCHWVNWHWPVTPAIEVKPGQVVRGMLTTPARTMANCWTLDWAIE